MPSPAAALATAGGTKAKGAPVQPGTVLAQPGTQPRALHELREGWVLRGALARGGDHQAVALYLPGDLFNPHWLHKPPGEAYWCASRASTRLIPLAQARALVPAETLWRQAALGEARLARWMLNLSRLSGIERVAALFCEVLFRLAGTRTGKGDCPWLLDRAGLAGCVGLTVDHAWRMAEELKLLQLAVLGRNRLHVPDMGRLARIAGFDPAYLE